jgi:predicted RND superfamily exporter protein
MRQRLFLWLARIAYRRAGTIFILLTILTVIAAALATHLRMDMTWNALVPENDPAALSYKEVIDNFGAATQIIVALEGDDTKQLIAAADALKPALESVQYLVPQSESSHAGERLPAAARVVVKYDTGFIAHHGLLLVKERELKQDRALFKDYNLVPYLRHTNDLLESEYVQDSDNLSKQEKEAVRGLDGMYEFVESLGAVASGADSIAARASSAVDRLTVGRGYLLSTDQQMLLVAVTPTLSITAPIDSTVSLVNAIDDAVQGVLAGYPGVRGSLTGGHVVSRDELEAGMSDTARNVTIAFVIILLVFVVSFRMFTGPLLAMLVLLAGISWDMGIAYLAIGRLNIFTAMCGVILIGLGVDFAIHILASYTELRGKGADVEEAIRETFLRTGSGLVTGALTTAAAFLSLLLTSYPVFREFGLVVGVGIISCLVASLTYLPAAIVLAGRLSKRMGRDRTRTVSLEYSFLGTVTRATTRRPIITVAVGLVVTVALGFFLSGVHMNKNYMDMEPRGLESIRLQREIPKRFNMSADNLFTSVGSIQEAQRLTDLLNERPAIGFVESITDYLPSEEKQKIRAPIVRSILEDQSRLPGPIPVDVEELIRELHRFSDNLTEMSSLAFISGLDRVFDKTNVFLGLNAAGDQVGTNHVDEIVAKIKAGPDAAGRLGEYQGVFARKMADRITGMADPQPITLEEVPADVRERFVSKDGKRYLIIVYAKSDLWNGLFTSPFIDTVVRDMPGASGMPLLMKAMVRTAAKEGKMALIYAAVAFLLLLMIDFRSIKTTLLAATPLAVSLLWLLGIMGLTGFPFSIVNVIGLPLILGIGIDDGVHIIHRYRREGQGSLPRTMSSIGRAIFLTTLTTVLGFGSLIPSSYRGYASMGGLATLGIGLCFIASVLLLPAILKLSYGRESGRSWFTPSSDGS